jgi:GcrA cell cycle regulator
MVWTHNQIEEIRRLWSVDGKTASQIGLVFGCTRNAIMGVIHRNGIKKGEATPTPQPRVEGRFAPLSGMVRRPPNLVLGKPDKRPVKPKPVVSVVSKEKTMPVQEPGPIVFWDLTPSSCRWPIGDPPLETLRFCGTRALDGRPYCIKHHRLSYQATANNYQRSSIYKKVS